MNFNIKYGMVKQNNLKVRIIPQYHIRLGGFITKTQRNDNNFLKKNTINDCITVSYAILLRY